MKAKHIPLFAALALLAVFFTGCNQPITNLTSPHVRANPSRIYTLTMNVRISNLVMLPDSLKAYVVIEGQEHEMARRDYGDQMYEFDYPMPADREEAKYYFVVRYDQMDKGIVKHREITSGPNVYTLNVDNRYVITMQYARGPVGTVIPVVGSNFQPQDKIVIGGVEAPTTFVSPNALTFTVPAIPADKNYAVELHSGTVVIPVDTFRVDAAKFTITPASVEVTSGESVLLTIDIGQKAPEGGLKIDVLTDVPASVVMPEVAVPAGQNATTVRIQGGAPGSGRLYVTAIGYTPVNVPVKVNAAPLAAPTPPAPEPPATPPPAPAAPAAAVQGS